MTSITADQPRAGGSKDCPGNSADALLLNARSLPVGAYSWRRAATHSLIQARTGS